MDYEGSEGLPGPERRDVVENPDNSAVAGATPGAHAS